MTSLSQAEEGLTLIELLAALVIGSVVSTLLVFVISYEFRSWQSIESQSNLRSNVIFTSNAIQQIFQNLVTFGPDENAPDGASWMGLDANGNTVKIQLKTTGTTGPSNGNVPIIGIAITDTSSPTGDGPPLVPSTVYTFNDTSFAGTNFELNDVDNVIELNLQATYYGTESPVVYQTTEDFTLGGGD